MSIMLNGVSYLKITEPASGTVAGEAAPQGRALRSVVDRLRSEGMCDVEFGAEESGEPPGGPPSVALGHCDSMSPREGGRNNAEPGSQCNSASDFLWPRLAPQPQFKSFSYVCF